MTDRSPLPASKSPSRDLAAWKSYSRLVTGNLLNMQLLERAASRALARHFGPGIEDCRALDVGCGFCGHLIALQRFGVEPQNLFGVDLREHSIASARTRFPLLNLSVCDARHLPFEDGHFDLVMQNVCFTSILDEDARRQVAREMMRVLKPDGLILWYDFRFDNPRNSQVRAVTRRQLVSYFPGMSLRIRPILLFPWLARQMEHSAWTPLFHLLYALPWIRTHYYAEIRWSGSPVAVS